MPLKYVDDGFYRLKLIVLIWVEMEFHIPYIFPSRYLRTTVFTFTARSMALSRSSLGIMTVSSFLSNKCFRDNHLYCSELLLL